VTPTEINLEYHALRRRLDELLEGRAPLAKVAALGQQLSRALAEIERVDPGLATTLRRDVIATMRKQIANRRGL
jgi:hypothetical protein